MLDNLNIEHVASLSKCCKEIEKLKEVNEELTTENRKLKLDNFHLKTVNKQLAENDGWTAEGNKMRNP
jgi:regulator of replication initiation timing